MGRIKTTYVKRKTKELLRTKGELFTSDFSQNKEITAKNTKVVSKKLRNVVAGYLTRLKRKGF
jgi:small subunit ribosomal protein S17e